MLTMTVAMYQCNSTAEAIPYGAGRGPGSFPCVDSQVLSFTGSDLQDVFQQLDVNNGGDGDAMNDYVAGPGSGCVCLQGQ
jgi:hypothetical protein